MDRRADFPSYPKDEEGDVVEPYSLWHIAVYADYVCAIWDMNGCGMSCKEFGDFQPLDERFDAWTTRHDVVFDKRHETGDYDRPHVPEAYLDELYRDGLQLCEELAVALRGKCKTIDFFPLERPPKRFFVPDPPQMPVSPES